MRIFRGKKKKVIEGREKPIWADVGFTMIIGDYEGRTTYRLIDERNGESYNLFEITKDGATTGSAPSGESGQDVPF